MLFLACFTLSTLMACSSPPPPVARAITKKGAIEQVIALPEVTNLVALMEHQAKTFPVEPTIGARMVEEGPMQGTFMVSVGEKRIGRILILYRFFVRQSDGALFVEDTRDGGTLSLAAWRMKYEQQLKEVEASAQALQQKKSE